MAQSVEKVPAETRWAIATQALTGAVTAASKALRDALGQDKYNEVWGQIWAEQGKTAKQAFQTWKHDKSRRVQALNDCAEILKKHAEPLSDILTREQGKPLSDASTEIAFSVVWFQATASFDLKTHVIQDDEKALIEIRRKPLGVIGAIAPWNYPILLAVWKIAPALLADNTVVLKPSPYTPLTTLKMGEILRDVLPPGVLNIVSGGDDLGSMITRHPAVRKISFTGSVSTGKKVAEASASDLKRIVLELGGNDPAIVLPDVKPQKVAKKLFWEAFTNSGQVCIAIKRLYIHETLYEPILDELANIARSVKVGDGLDPETQIGPLNNRKQYERVIELVEDAKKSGAKFVTGGEPLNLSGYFYPLPL